MRLLLAATALLLPVLVLSAAPPAHAAEYCVTQGAVYVGLTTVFPGGKYCVPVP
jgi:hypothetical protein